MHLPSFDRIRAAELLKEPANAPLSSLDVASRAHRRWDLKQHLESALLFSVASERARAEFSAGRTAVDQSPNYFVRAAINFDLAGEVAFAEPMLNEATRIDWHGLGLANDSHMTEWAFVQLLMSVRPDSKQSFAELFDRAVLRCRELGWDFPKIHPKQEALLRACMALGLPSIVQRLVELIAHRRPISREARALLRSAGGFLSKTES